ncbi:uncharacterized protein FOMMEDRAFT_161297 [Fomitiporia mediterranea MF3/22]|uniref:uncharacterized protein n=1 Tax=Fomitiporia mediterranea (strain MF3/22) TaxID=694068 RepID=UPI0004407760|nr:uncharacterized protein FOMMEDRAFT_161297 [Fomitiporia mediterranea MF3/22]EJC99067.1 hypothetical protein FOMMEDRAFT_161297 [Fomitiporia mediterranea MF3/22]
MRREQNAKSIVKRAAELYIQSATCVLHARVVLALTSSPGERRYSIMMLLGWCLFSNLGTATCIRHAPCKITLQLVANYISEAAGSDFCRARIVMRVKHSVVRREKVHRLNPSVSNILYSCNRVIRFGAQSPCRAGIVSPRSSLVYHATAALRQECFMRLSGEPSDEECVTSDEGELLELWKVHIDLHGPTGLTLLEQGQQPGD